MKRIVFAIAAALLMFAAVGTPAVFAGSDRCDEAEHAGDPDCAESSNSGPGSRDDDDDDDRDNSGPGSDDDDDDRDNSGPGSDDDRDDDDRDDDDDDSPSPSPSPDDSVTASPSPSSVSIASPSPSSVSIASASGARSAVGGSTYSAAAPPTSGTVTIVDDDYEPPTYEVAVGGTVNWKQAGDRPHTVTADDGSFDSGMMATGKTFSHTFTKAGTFRYFCEFHGGKGGDGMAGTVVVKAAGTAAKPAAGTAPASDTAASVGSDSVETGARSSGGLARTGVAVGAIAVLAAIAIGVGLFLRRAARAR